MFYTLGSSEDYDRYANITRDPGWSWNSLQQFIHKVWTIFFLGYLCSNIHRTKNGLHPRTTTTQLDNSILLSTASRESILSASLDLLRRSTIALYKPRKNWVMNFHSTWIWILGIHSVWVSSISGIQGLILTKRSFQAGFKQLLKEDDAAAQLRRT